MTDQQIENTFTYHRPTTEQAERYETLRAKARELAQTFKNLGGPPSRELSLAFTHLQQAVMWANASIACNEPSAR